MLRVKDQLDTTTRWTLYFVFNREKWRCALCRLHFKGHPIRLQLINNITPLSEWNATRNSPPSWADEMAWEFAYSRWWTRSKRIILFCFPNFRSFLISSRRLIGAIRPGAAQIQCYARCICLLLWPHLYWRWRSTPKSIAYAFLAWIRKTTSLVVMCAVTPRRNVESISKLVSEIPKEEIDWGFWVIANVAFWMCPNVWVFIEQKRLYCCEVLQFL